MQLAEMGYIAGHIGVVFCWIIEPTIDEMLIGSVDRQAGLVTARPARDCASLEGEDGLNLIPIRNVETGRLLG
jgi:hypothetical protein